MEFINNIIQAILDMGSTAVLPIMILLLGLFFRMKFFPALKSGITVGIGFIGLNLCVDLLFATIGPIAEYWTSVGTGFPIVDLGWPAQAAAAWATPFALVLVPVCFLINILLFRVKFTKTLNIDIWNYWHFLLVSTVAYVVFDSFVVAALIGIAASIFILKAAEVVAPWWQDRLGMEGTTCGTLLHLGFTWPVCWAVNKLIDLIPGLNKLDVSLEKVQQKFNALGDPAIIGILVGVLLSVLSRQPIATIPTIAMKMAGALILLPRMVSLLVEGLSPVSRAAKNFVQERFGKDADVLICLDSACLCGDPAAVTTAVFMIPIVLFFCLVIPGIRYLPYTEFASFAFFTGIASTVTKGNLLRILICTTICVMLVVVCAQFMAPLFTQAFIYGGVAVTGEASGHIGINIFSLLLGGIHGIIH